MTRLLPGAQALLILGLVTLFAIPADAQYFGRNKVRHESFDFELLHTPHFDIYYYPKEEAAAHDVAKMAERWYSRLSSVLDHRFNKRKPIVLYADDTDFQQTNIIGGELGQGTGGVTESFKNRVVMPLTGSYADTDHVLGHEIVHVFQYDRAQRARSARLQLGRLPLWFIEGMAEYLSVGPTSAHSALWLRDAVLYEELPSDRDLAANPRYFPYRFGHAMWSYITGRWGDGIVIQLYDACIRMGLELGFEKVLGETPAKVVEAWHPTLKSLYAEQIEGRQQPKDVGRFVLGESNGGRMNLAPTLSPDGKLLAFLSERNLFSIDLFLADAETGEVLSRLASADANAHIDALRFIDSAGSWSPDGSQFAFVVFKDGNNEIALLDVESRKVVRRVSVRDVGSLSNPAWSPDGRRIAFSGLTGTASDLFVLDLETEDLVRLSNDAYADMRPAWSPDGTTLAFVTDRGAGNVERLSWGNMGIGLVSVETGVISTVLRPFPGADHTDPAYGPNGHDLYFTSNRAGFRNIYRMDLRDRRTYQVTNVATGVTGITELSPAMSVAAETGAVAFTVFRQSNYEIHSLTAEEAQGIRVEDAAPVELGDELPPLERDSDSEVAKYLEDIESGVPDEDLFRYSEYKASLGLDYIGQSGVGLFVDRFGAGVSGGIFAGFSDMLGNHNLGLALQTVGGFKDTGAAALYYNQKNRYNWGISASHLPFLSVRTFATATDVQIDGSTFEGVTYEVELSRVFLEELAFQFHYPVSRRNRLEVNVSGKYYSFDTERETFVTIGNSVITETKQDIADEPGFGLFDVGFAYVGDTSFYGFASPIRGERYRLEVSPTVGSLRYTTALVDYRRYLFKNPATLGFRAIHFGRYGRDGESGRLVPLYLGYPSLVRGYDLDSQDISECDGAGDCPVYDNLEGSRVAIASLELRTQLLGTASHGLIPFPYLPLQLSAFVDAGMAWSSDDPVRVVFERNPTRRVPVVSAGFTARIPLFGALPLEFYFARPFQRPEKDWVFGFQLAPGW